MFKKTISLTMLKKEPIKSLREIQKSDSQEVIQVVHRGSPNKVIMTEEYYRTLISRLEHYERNNEQTEFLN